MSDVSRVHADAIVAMLDPLTSPPSNYQVYVGKVTVPDAELEYPYLCVWRAPAARDILNLAGNLSDATTVTQVTAFGRDDDEVMAALDRVAELLHGHKPTIPGRIPGFIRQLPGEPFVVPTDDVHTDGQPAYQGVLFFQLNSTAAAA